MNAFEIEAEGSFYYTCQKCRNKDTDDYDYCRGFQKALSKLNDIISHCDYYLEIEEEVEFYDMLRTRLLKLKQLIYKEGRVNK